MMAENVCQVKKSEIFYSETRGTSAIQVSNLSEPEFFQFFYPNKVKVSA